MLIKYVRDFERRPFACVVATENGIGYSVCHDRDRFNKKLAREIAIGRADFGRDNPDGVATSKVVTNDGMETKRELVRKAIEQMKVRAEKYWK